jgi:guanine nucleotide-binding protein subunit alpha
MRGADDRKIAFENITGGMATIIDILDEQGIAVLSSNRKHIQLVDNRPSLNSGEPFPTRYLEPLKSLWADPAVQNTYSRGHEFAAPENLG